jgi:hypothetical protein
MENTTANTVTTSTIPDAWQTESGLPDDFDGVISGAIFCTKPDYQDGTVPLLELTIEGKDIDPTPVLFSLGKGWIIKDGGARVEHEKGKQHFITNSIYGRLIHRVTIELAVQMPPKSSPMEAESWLNLAFHWSREELDFGGAKSNILAEKGGKVVHLMPVLFLKDYAAATAAKAPALDIPPELAATLTTYAQAAPDFASFFKLAFKLPELKANPELLNNVMLETDAGYYKTHHSK